MNTAMNATASAHFEKVLNLCYGGSVLRRTLSKSQYRDLITDTTNLPPAFAAIRDEEIAGFQEMLEIVPG